MLIRALGLLAALACTAPVAPARADPVVTPEIEVVADVVPAPGEPGAAAH